MGAPLFNAKDRLLNQNSGTVPDVSDTLFDWFQEMTFTRIVKTVENFKVVEKPTSFTFMGVWQPFTDKDLMLKPEGQRAWSWFTLHAQPTVLLNTDDVVTYLGVQYRVMKKSDYGLYGYLQYQLVTDYTGAGP